MKRCYFSHDLNARTDEKILQMRADWGLEGYGLYWCLIECMAESNLNYSIREKSIKGLQVSFNIAFKRLHAFIEQCLNEYELFEKEDDLIYSPRLREQMLNIDKISENLRNAALSKWEKARLKKASNLENLCDSSTTELTSQCSGSNPVVTPYYGGYANEMKLNEMKLDEMKSNHIEDQNKIISKEINNNLLKKRKDNIYNNDFETFYSIYPRKISKTKTLKCFNKRIEEGVNPKDLISAAKNYAKSREGEDPKYTKHPATFIGVDKHYEDFISGIPENGKFKKDPKKGWAEPSTEFSGGIKKL